ncbi:MAG TPA: DUF1549 domain-containing protein [Bryobacteraceae bacterium]|nr:DUF1549 domain-containing protein [Bryobacteraceae bacterium]
MLFLVLAMCQVRAQSSAADASFARDVQPIFNARCAACHTGSEAQAGLRLHTRAEMLKGGVSGPAIVAGSSANSLLVARITGEKQPLMPLAGKPLSAAEIDVIRRWIDAGAPGPGAIEEPSWTPVLSPRRPDVPENTSFRNPIDRFMAAYFQKAGVAFPEAVSGEVFLRRVYLDLWGLLPTPQQRLEFLNNTGPDSRERLIEKLLAAEEPYSGHWISFWNDLLHNDEGVSYVGDRKSITPWLVDALQKNLPYDRFARALLNPTEDSDPEGFLLGVNWRGDVNASQTAVMQAAQNSAQVFLAVNLKCNSCHDSFISKWKLADAYGLASFYSEKPLELVRCDVPTGKTAVARFLYPELGGVATDAPLKEKREVAARLFTSPENGRFTRTFVNRVWKQLFGRGLVEPVDDLDAEPWNADLLDWLASSFAEHGYDIQYLLRAILNSRTYQLPAVDSAADPADRKEKFVFRGPQYRRLTAEQFVDAISAMTGEWRILQPRKAGEGTYSREWRLKASSLTRTLGRPIRDSAVTERNTAPSTLQALEMANGETAATLLHRGALRMLGQLPTPPPNRFDSGVFRSDAIHVDVEISGARELRLLLEDHDSYDPARVTAGWTGARLTGPEGEVPLAELPSRPAFQTGTLKIKGHDAQPAVLAPLSSELVFDLSGRRFTRFQATVGVDESSQTSDISPSVRTFVFTEEPDRMQLVRVAGAPPVPPPPALTSVDDAISRVYLHALGREPSTRERASARQFFGGGRSVKLNSDGLEDFLWAVVMLPEFQFIR